MWEAQPHLSGVALEEAAVTAVAAAVVVVVVVWRRWS
jgi:hypothetical protein